MGRHALMNATGAVQGTSPQHHVTEEEGMAASLIYLVPTNFDRACNVSKKLHRRVGVRGVKRLTGISGLRCERNAAQLAAEARGEYAMPLSKRKYEKMASFIEARTKKSSDEKLQASTDVTTRIS